MGISNLYELKIRDVNKSSDVVAKAFYNYPTMKHIFKEKHSEDNLRITFRFVIKYAVLYGRAYASSSQLEGVILFCDYKDYKFTFFRALRAGALSLIKLGPGVGKRFSEFNDFNVKIHEKIIKAPHQYIILMGVDPSKQGQGYASKLMSSVLEVAKEKNQPCYLETHSCDNVEIYRKYGFELASKNVIPGSNITQWSMLKE